MLHEESGKDETATLDETETTRTEHMDKSAAFPLLNSIQDGQFTNIWNPQYTKHALVAPVSAHALVGETKIH